MESQSIGTLVKFQVDPFDNLSNGLHEQFGETLHANGPHLFEVAPEGDLFDIYLNYLPESERQRHHCHCCRRFIERFGRVVSINADGTLRSAVWNPAKAPDLYQNAVTALQNVVQQGRVREVFLAEEALWGQPRTGRFNHLFVKPGLALTYRHAGQTAAQARSDQGENRAHLAAGLAAFSRDHLLTALLLLEGETIYRHENLIVAARWLLKVIDALDSALPDLRPNLLWLAAASAPSGFCQIQHSPLGRLLTDIRSGRDITEIQRRFDARMQPQRSRLSPIPPTFFNIRLAEKVIAKSGLEPALRRRFARLEEIPTFWQPAQKRSTTRTRADALRLPTPNRRHTGFNLPTQAISWAIFQRAVLPNAAKIELYLNPRMNFCALVTAVNPDAPPILQWDESARRNPFSWYVCNGGATPEQWLLRSGGFVNVTGLVLQPSQWYNEQHYRRHGQGVLFILEGALDSSEPGLCLFPEMLRAECQPILGAIEACTKKAKMGGRAEASACGVLIAQGEQAMNHQLRVTNAQGVFYYRINVWD